jgi:chemotaxis protein CheX
VEQYIQPFIKVSERVFEDFCKTKIEAKKVFFTEKEEHKFDWDISGIIGLSGEVHGAVAISMKDVTAFKIAEILMNMKFSSFEKEVTASVGEIVNIISRKVKKDFEEELKIKISLPTIITGNAHRIDWPSEKARIICIPFSVFSNQEFYLSVAIDTSKQK